MSGVARLALFCSDAVIAGDLVQALDPNCTDRGILGVGTYPSIIVSGPQAVVVSAVSYVFVPLRSDLATFLQVNGASGAAALQTLRPVTSIDRRSTAK